MAAGDRVHQVLATLRGGPATDLPALLTAAAKCCYPVSAVDILIVDYNLTALAPVEGAAEPVPIDGSREGQVFTSQQASVAVERDHASHLICPLTVRGQRLGVVSAVFSDEWDDQWLPEWQQIAEHVAHEVVVAESITDRFRQARRRRRLTLAAEIQWDSVPARSVATAEYAFAGQLEPAYQVCGDTFDWTTDKRGLTTVVINGYNHGTPAAVLTNFAIAALRNARRSGDDLAAQAELASDLLYTDYTGSGPLDALLMRYEAVTGRLLAISTGNAQVIRLHGTAVTPLDLPAQPSLGAQEEAHYVATPIPATPGDRILVVSDGVHTSPNASNEPYGLLALGRVLRRTRLQPCGEAVRTIIRDVLDYHGSGLDDDAVVTCLDLLPPDR